jgi:hypothetical protein
MYSSSKKNKILRNMFNVKVKDLYTEHEKNIDENRDNISK